MAIVPLSQLTPKTTAPQQGSSPSATVEKGNTRNRSILQSLGIADPTKKKGASALERIFGVLDVGGAGTRSVIHNIVNPATDQDVNPWQEMGKSLQGQRRIEGADILGDLGVGNKWLKMLGGVALDIATDPVTYITAGISNIAKAESASRLGRMALEGMTMADLADHGVDTATVASRVVEGATQGVDNADDAARIAAELGDALVSGAKKIAASDLTVDESRTLASSLRKMVAQEFGDKGGLKFMGQTIIPSQGAMEQAVYTGKDIARSTKFGRWFETAFVNGQMTPVTAVGNEAVNAGVKLLKKDLGGTIALGRDVGEQVSKTISDLVPDATVRDLMTLGIGRQFGNFADQGDLRKLYDAYHEAVKAGDTDLIESTLEAVRSETRKLWSPDAVAETVKQFTDDPDTIEAVAKATEKVQAHLDNLAELRKGAGLPNWSLYASVEGAPNAAGYMPGMAPEVRTGLFGRPAKETQQATEAAQKAVGSLGLEHGGVEGATEAPLTVANLLNPEKAPTSSLFRAGKKAYKSKDYVNAEQRMVEGGLLTELDAAKLAAAKTSQDYTDIAWKSLEDGLNKLAGTDGNEAIQKMAKAWRGTFATDEATKGFIATYDKVLNAWKRTATALNLPMFQSRNMISNKVLQYTEGLLDPAAEAKSLGIIKSIATGQIDDVTRAEIDKLVQLGVIQDAAQFAEQVAGGAFHSKLGKIGGGVNALVENQGRIASYYAAKAQGAGDDAAKLMVDTALYNYSKEAYSEFERSVMMRLVPFFRWMKSNTVHMVDVLAKRPGKLTWVGHLKEAGEATQPPNEEVMPDWMRDLFPIPLPMNDKKGNQVMLSTAGLVPVGDLERLNLIRQGKVELKDVLASLSPIIKTPLELAFNKDVYYDSPISAYPGQTKAAPGYVQVFDNAVKNVPGVSDAWDIFKKAFDVETRVNKQTGESYLAMNAYAMKALRDLNPWLNNMGKLVSTEEKYQTFPATYATGIKTVSFDEQQLAQAKAYDDQAKLLEAVSLLKEQGKLPAKPKKVSTANLLKPKKRAAPKKAKAKVTVKRAKKVTMKGLVKR